MKFLFLLLILSVLKVEASWWSGIDKPECAFSRDDAVKCIRKHVDLNHDNEITTDELDAARKKYMTGFQKTMIWIASLFTDELSDKKILENCDHDKDGVVTVDDFRLTSATCLPTQHELCVLKGVCDKADSDQS